MAGTQAGRLIRSAEQHQEERPISLVFGSGSAAFRTVHDDLPFGRAQAPPPYAAALFQEPFKNRKLIRHLRSLIGQPGLVSLDLVAGFKFLQQSIAKLHERAIIGGPFALRVRAARSCDAEHLPRN